MNKPTAESCISVAIGCGSPPAINCDFGVESFAFFMVAANGKQAVACSAVFDRVSWEHSNAIAEK